MKLSAFEQNINKYYMFGGYVINSTANQCKNLPPPPQYVLVSQSRLLMQLLGFWTLSRTMDNEHHFNNCIHILKQTPWSEFMSKLYRLSDRHLSAKLVPTFADKSAMWSA
jgi:hypothetical protein